MFVRDGLLLLLPIDAERRIRETVTERRASVAVLDEGVAEEDGASTDWPLTVMSALQIAYDCGLISCPASVSVGGGSEAASLDPRDDSLRNVGSFGELHLAHVLTDANVPQHQVRVAHDSTVDAPASDLPKIFRQI